MSLLSGGKEMTLTGMTLKTNVSPYTGWDNWRCATVHKGVIINQLINQPLGEGLNLLPRLTLSSWVKGLSSLSPLGNWDYRC